jgi:hypothetical protein
LIAAAIFSRIDCTKGFDEKIRPAEDAALPTI